MQDLWTIHSVSHPSYGPKSDTLRCQTWLGNHLEWRRHVQIKRNTTKHNDWLVVTATMELYDFPFSWEWSSQLTFNFFRGVGTAPTRLYRRWTCFSFFGEQIWYWLILYLVQFNLNLFPIILIIHDYPPESLVQYWICQFWGSIQGEAPKIAKLVYKWLNSMVYGRYNYSIHGDYFMVYKPTFTLRLGAPSCGWCVI